MSGGWFYYEGDDRPKPTAAQRAALDQADRERAERRGPRLGHISIDFFETETTVHMGFGNSEMTPAEVRDQISEFVRRAIEELQRYR